MRALLTLFVGSSLCLSASVVASPCSVIPNAAIQKMLGEKVSNAKPVSQISGELRYSQCFYSLSTFTNSISISVVTPSPSDMHRDAPRELWQRWFHRDSEDADRDAAGKSEEEEAGSKALPISNLGDEAFWVHSFVGNLYVLKGNSFLRISIGGKLTDEERQKRAKALAAAALKNLR